MEHSLASLPLWKSYHRSQNVPCARFQECPVPFLVLHAPGQPLAWHLQFTESSSLPGAGLTPPGWQGWAGEHPRCWSHLTDAALRPREPQCEWCFCPSPHPGYPAAPCPGALAAPFPATASGCTPRQSVPLRFSEPQPGPSARPQCGENRQAGLRVTVRAPACRLGTPALQMSPQVEQTFPLPVTSPKTLKMGMEWEVGLRAGPSFQGPHSVPEETGIEGGACPRPANGSKPPSRPLLSVSPVCPQWA